VRLLLRLIVMGVGLGVITGTGLRLLAPHLADGPIRLPGSKASAGLSTAAATPRGLRAGSFDARSELTALSQQWQQLAAAQKDLQATGFLLVLDDGRFAQLNADQPMPAASSIKTPILLVALDALDKGKLRWNQPLQLTKELVGGGAGWMGSKPIGTRFPLYEAATEMIRVSDNSATNLVIQQLGQGFGERQLQGQGPAGHGAEQLAARPGRHQHVQQPRSGPHHRPCGHRRKA
jgi:beta-lactamase class A